MDALPELLGAGFPVQFAGQTWQAMPLRCRDYAEAAEIIRSKKTRPLDAVANLWPALQTLAPEDRQAAVKQLLELAYRDEREGDLVAHLEVTRWFGFTEVGKVHRNWFMLRQKHPTLTFDDVERLMQEEATRIILEAAAPELDGMPRGNSSGGASPPDSEPTTAGPGAPSSAA